MDCVEGMKGDEKVILTLTFRNCNLMLMFLIEHQTQECVVAVLDWLKSALGAESFKRLFPVILTDGGSEFAARKAIENLSDGTQVTTVFYCKTPKLIKK